MFADVTAPSSCTSRNTISASGTCAQHETVPVEATTNAAVVIRRQAGSFSGLTFRTCYCTVRQLPCKRYCRSCSSRSSTAASLVVAGTFLGVATLSGVLSGLYVAAGHLGKGAHSRNGTTAGLRSILLLALTSSAIPNNQVCVKKSQLQKLCHKTRTSKLGPTMNCMGQTLV